MSFNFFSFVSLKQFLFFVAFIFVLCGAKRASATSYNPGQWFDYSIELVGDVPPELVVKYYLNESGSKTPAILNRSSKSFSFQMRDGIFYQLIHGRQYSRAAGKKEWRLKEKGGIDGFFLDARLFRHMGLPIVYEENQTNRPVDIQIPSPHRIKIPANFEGRDYYLEAQVTYFLSRDFDISGHRIFPEDSMMSKSFLPRILGALVTSVVISYWAIRKLMQSKKIKNRVGIAMKIAIFIVINIVVFSGLVFGLVWF